MNGNDWQRDKAALLERLAVDGGQGAPAATGPAMSPAQAEAEIRRLTPRYREWLHRHGFDAGDAGSGHNQAVMARYMARYRLGLAEKGLCLVGMCGRGKTWAMSRFALWSRCSDFWTASDVVADDKRHGTILADLERPRRHLLGGESIWPDCIIDDLGAEPRRVDYGQAEELMARLIASRERLYVECGARLHVTTNLEERGIIERYGERTWSRINGICWIVQFQGDDRRMTKQEG